MKPEGSPKEVYRNNGSLPDYESWKEKVEKNDKNVARSHIRLANDSSSEQDTYNKVVNQAALLLEGGELTTDEVKKLMRRCRLVTTGEDMSSIINEYNQWKNGSRVENVPIRCKELLRWLRQNIKKLETTSKELENTGEQLKKNSKDEDLQSILNNMTNCVQKKGKYAAELKGIADKAFEWIEKKLEENENHSSEAEKKSAFPDPLC